MRVALAHNRYQSSAPSGENRVVDLEIAALRARGHEVIDLQRDSDELAGSPRAMAEAAVAPLRPSFSLRRLRSILRRTRPDVLHLHNAIPLFPPALVTLAQQLGIPVVQTIHNGRYGCPKTDFFRDGAECFDCLGRRFPFPAALHSCYRGSAPQSLALAASLALHRPTFAAIDRFIALSRSSRDLLSRSGIPSERTVIVPHGIPDPGLAKQQPREELLFVGRLEQEKGVLELLDAWGRIAAGSSRELVIAGSGPLSDHVAEQARTLPKLRWVGRLTPTEVSAAMARATAVLVPSLVPESFGLAAVEAFAVGRPVVSSGAGALDELVDDEVGWSAGSAAELAAVLPTINAEDAARRGAAARERFVERYTLDRATENLIDVFDSVTVSAG